MSGSPTPALAELAVAAFVTVYVVASVHHGESPPWRRHPSGVIYRASHPRLFWGLGVILPGLLALVLFLDALVIDL